MNRTLKYALATSGSLAALLISPLIFMILRGSLVDWEDRRMREVTVVELSRIDKREDQSSYRCIFPPKSLTIVEPLQRRFNGYSISRWTNTEDWRIWTIAEVDAKVGRIELRKLLRTDAIEFGLASIPCGAQMSMHIIDQGVKKVVEFRHVDFWLR